MKSGCARLRKICGPRLLRSTFMISARTRSPTRAASRGICWSRRITPSARPRLTITWPNSTDLITPVMISPARSLNSSNWRSRSASRTFWKITCLARLRVDAAEIDRGQRIDDEVADLGAGLKLFGLLQIDLLEVILDLFDHFDHAPQAQIAGAADRAWRGCRSPRRNALRADFWIASSIASMTIDLSIIFSVATDVGDCEQFSLVGGNRTGHRVQSSSSSRMSSPSSSTSSTPEVSSGRVAAISRSVKTSLAE